MELLNELLAKQLEFQKSLESMNKKFDDQAQKKPSFNVDHQAITNQIRAGLPTVEQFEKVNEQLKRTISSIPDRIPVQTSGEILGFTNLKALFIHWLISLSLLVLLGGWITYSKNQEINTLKYQAKQAAEFYNWIKKNYPNTWDKWLAD